MCVWGCLTLLMNPCAGFKNKWYLWELLCAISLCVVMNYYTLTNNILKRLYRSDGEVGQTIGVCSKGFEADIFHLF